MQACTALLITGILATMAGCSDASLQQTQEVMLDRYQITTGQVIAADPNEARHDLLVLLQHRTGRFINSLDGGVSGMLQIGNFTPAQSTWLRTLRLDGEQGILSAIQQDDVLDSEIETLFFTRLLRQLKSRQAKQFFDAATAHEIEVMLAQLEAVFWGPLESTLGTWDAGISLAVDEFIEQNPDTPSISFASSDLYVVVDPDDRERLTGMFGLNERLEMAAQGIGHLKRTADRAVFLAEFMPLLVTRYAETIAADLINTLAGGPLTNLHTEIAATAANLFEKLEQRQQELSDSLHSSSETIRAALSKLDHDLTGHIDTINDAIHVDLQSLAREMAGITQSTTHLNATVDTLTLAVSELATTIKNMPDNLISSINTPNDTIAHGISSLESRLQFNLALLITGIMLATVIASVVVVLLVLKLTR